MCRQRGEAKEGLWLSYLELAFNVFSFTPYQHLTIPIQRRDTMQRLVIVSHSPATADRKGKCLLLPLPASCPSLHPSVTSFLLSLSLTPHFPPPSLLCPVSPFLPICTTNFPCVVFPVRYQNLAKLSSRT